MSPGGRQQVIVSIPVLHLGVRAVKVFQRVLCEIMACHGVSLPGAGRDARKRGAGLTLNPRAVTARVERAATDFQSISTSIIQAVC